MWVRRNGGVGNSSVEGEGWWDDNSSLLWGSLQCVGFYWVAPISPNTVEIKPHPTSTFFESHISWRGASIWRRVKVQARFLTMQKTRSKWRESMEHVLPRLLLRKAMFPAFELLRVFFSPVLTRGVEKRSSFHQMTLIYPNEASKKEVHDLQFAEMPNTLTTMFSKGTMYLNMNSPWPSTSSGVSRNIFQYLKDCKNQVKISFFLFINFHIHSRHEVRSDYCCSRYLPCCSICSGSVRFRFGNSSTLEDQQYWRKYRAPCRGWHRSTHGPNQWNWTYVSSEWSQSALEGMLPVHEGKSMQAA